MNTWIAKVPQHPMPVLLIFVPCVLIGHTLKLEAPTVLFVQEFNRVNARLQAGLLFLAPRTP